MTHPSPSVSKIAEANMQRWLEREKLDRKIVEQAKKAELGPYIVFSRQCGSHGEEIAALVAKRLGWDMLDREIIESVAKDHKVTEHMVEFVDEKHVAWLTELFEAWILGQDFCQEGYVQELGKLIMIAAQHGDFVMVGRGSQFILPRKYGLFVRLHAPYESRVANIMKSQQITEQEASDFVSKTDADRAIFLKTYFGSDGADAGLYDLVIDTSHFEPENVAALIQTAADSRNRLA